MRDVAGGHDVICVANLGHGLGLGAARNGEVLTNSVAGADAQIAARAGEVLIEGIGA